MHIFIPRLVQAKSNVDKTISIIAERTSSEEEKSDQHQDNQLMVTKAVEVISSLVITIKKSKI